MSLASRLLRRALLVCWTAAALAACSADVGGGDGAPVSQQQPTTGTTGFDTEATGTFVAGTPPETASFQGGLVRGGKWIIRDDTTGMVVFAAPPRQTGFDMQTVPLEPAVAAAKAARDRFSKATCGIADAGLDNEEAFGGQLFLRGGFNDWSPLAPWGFINTGDGIYQVEQTFAAGEYEYKIAQQSWDVFDRVVLGESTEPDSTYTLSDPGPGGPNGVLVIPTEGCWNVTLNASDPANITLVLTRVELDGGGGGGKTECGVSSQGLDDGEAFGGQLFLRGAFNDWGPLPDWAFYNFGDGSYQAEHEFAAGGTFQYKIAQEAWDVFDRAVLGGVDTVPDQVLPLEDPGPGGPNGNLVLPAAGCWNFEIDATDPAALTLRVTEVDTSGGGGGGAFKGVEIRLFAPDGSAISTEQVDAAAGPLDERMTYTRTGSEVPIGRLEIESQGGAGDIYLDDFFWTVNPRDVPAAGPVTIYYHRPEGDYSATDIIVDGQRHECVPHPLGCSVTIQAVANSTIAFTVENAGVPDPTGTFIGNTGSSGNSVYAYSGNPEAVTATLDAAPGPDEVLVFYQRDDADYGGWAIHLFPSGSPDWTLFSPGLCTVSGVDPVFGAYFRVTLPPNPCYDADPPPLDDFPAQLGFIIHKGDEKDPGPDQFVRIAEQGNIVFVTSGVATVGSAPPSGSRLSVVGRAAHWVAPNTLLWDPVAGSTDVELLWSADGSIGAGIGALEGNYESADLGAGVNPAPDNQRHLAALPAWSLPSAAAARAKELVGYQLVAVAKDRFGIPVDATYVQIPGVLDALYGEAAATVPLGVTWNAGAPTVRVWAPTADAEAGVTLTLYADAAGTVADEVAMTLDTATGVWTATGTSAWDRRYYDFTLRVWSYAAEAFVTNRVTDPWSASLSADSGYSQIVDLDDTDLKPSGWDAVALPALEAPEDIVLYELHMRDFSAFDPQVPDSLKGRYEAFALESTAGHDHLSALADAGLTHVHLLPVFDIATIRERRAERVELEDPVADLCVANPAAAGLCPIHSGKSIRQLLAEITAQDPRSEQQQQIATWLSDLDGFNWGYDPWHFGVPEGSYATDPDGVTRIVEFRRMVQGLAGKGLRMVMDVVYNHTNEGGQGQRSVLDRIVPGYYHRYHEATGAIETSTCCANTATEFVMMEKLMTDTLVRFARDYKVGGFRFDLMGHQPKAAMLRVRDTLLALDPALYLYGEGWDFGEVAGNRRFEQATQVNMSGTGIGTFTDRLRDAARGGGPFDSGGAHVSTQGFISGGGYDPNATNRPPGDAFVNEALLSADQLRAALAGSISSFTFQNMDDEVVTGADVPYGGSPTAYVEDPQEIINYTEAHDNETLWDVSQYKQPSDTTTAERVRAHNLGLDLVLLAQGVPFIHAGQDLLRSKSFDRDSFNHTDWFNRLDLTYQDNNWAVGLPDREKNQASWPQIDAALANALADVAPQDIQFANQHFREMLEVRKSTVLFRLRTGAQINSRVQYFNTGMAQRFGVIAQGIDGCSSGELAPEFGYVLTVINANDEPQSLDFGGEFAGQAFALHPVLASSIDPAVQTAAFDGATGTFSVPARTTAVFVRAEQFTCSPFGVDVFVRGLNGDWSDAPQNLLPFQGGSTYQGMFELSAVSQEFKVASSDWSTVNCGSGEPDVTLDEAYALFCDPNSGNLRLSVPATGAYLFTVEAADPANPVLTVSKAPPYPVDIFVRGFNGDWSDSADNRLAFVGNDRYSTVLNLADASVQANRTFKVASSDWSTVNCGTGEVTATPGAPYALNCAADSGDIELATAQNGLYGFLVDASDPANPVLTVEKTPYDVTVFVRGLNQDWSESQPMRYAGGGSYEATLTLQALEPGDRSFKVASADWSTVNCGAGMPTILPAIPYALNCAPDSGDVSLDTDQTGRYRFELEAAQPATPTLTVTGP